MIRLVQADLTTLAVDALVNAANAQLAGGGGVDGAVHRAAGPDLMVACRTIGGCPTGSAVVTPGFRLAARFVIHAVGPIWRGGEASETLLLRKAYQAAFARAREVGARSVAFPALSTGAYGFPLEPAARIALHTMREEQEDFDEIVACLYDARALQIYERAWAELARGA